MAVKFGWSTYTPPQRIPPPPPRKWRALLRPFKSNHRFFDQILSSEGGRLTSHSGWSERNSWGGLIRLHWEWFPVSVWKDGFKRHRNLWQSNMVMKRASSVDILLMVQKSGYPPGTVLKPCKKKGVFYYINWGLPDFWTTRRMMIMGKPSSCYAGFSCTWHGEFPCNSMFLPIDVGPFSEKRYTPRKRTSWKWAVHDNQPASYSG